MIKRISMFITAIMLLPFLFSVWLLVGGIFLIVPFYAFINPDFVNCKKKIRMFK